MGSGFLTGIERTLRMRGTLVQRMLCAAMMAILSFARLPGGGRYCCPGRDVCRAAAAAGDSAFRQRALQAFAAGSFAAQEMLPAGARWLGWLAAPRLHDALAEHGALGENRPIG
ncbi:MAG: hypothetical protein ACLVB5_03780 [Christensenellales bacterium]